jgi:prophage antirepressor-like protein
MENNELTPFFFENGTMRTTVRDGEPWFVAKDVCDILGITNSRDALAKMLDDDEQGVETFYTRSESGVEQRRELNIVNESGLYNLIFRSNKPEARAFRKWVTSTVLPAIRKTGQYRIELAKSEQDKLVREIINNVLPGSTVSGYKRMFGRYMLTSGGRVYVLKVGNNRYELLLYDRDGTFCGGTTAKGIKSVPLATVLELHKYPALGKCVRYSGVYGKWVPVEEAREIVGPLEVPPDDYLVWVEELKKERSPALEDTRGSIPQDTGAV